MEEADTGASVTVQQLAAFHTQGNTATTYWYAQGKSGSLYKLFNTANDDGQSFFPYASGTTTPAAASFSTTSVFGFKDDTVYSDDSLNKNTPGGGHHVRFYPMYDTSETSFPTYIMSMDYTNVPENFDFQDNVWVVSNIRPVTTVPVHHLRRPPERPARRSTCISPLNKAEIRCNGHRCKGNRSAATTSTAAVP